MKLRRLLVPAAVIAGSLAIFAGTASAAVTCVPSHGHGQQNTWQDSRTQPWCVTVQTPQEPNYSWVQNTTGETVTVTLSGNYWWVQTRDGSDVTYLGPKTTTVTLAPGESISVAWRSSTGEHSWCWTGECAATVSISRVTPPCNPRTGGYTGRLPCDKGHRGRFTIR